jgi:hypothetical protein
MPDEILTKNIVLGIAPLLPKNNRPFRSAVGASRTKWIGQSMSALPG